MPTHGSNITIRRLTVDDAARWRSIRLAALQESPDAFGQPYADAVSKPLSFFAEAVGAEDPIFAALDGDAAVACAGVHTIAGIKTAHRALLWGVFVAPEYRNKKLGGRLLDAAVAYARPRYLQLHLRVLTTNAAAYALYLSRNFEPYGIEPRALLSNGRYFDETMMVLRLDEMRAGAAT